MRIYTVISRSLIAMFWGWLACNAALFLCALCFELFHGSFLIVTVFFTAYAMLYSSVAVLAAWLVIFLPTDLLVKESSILRLPEWAGPCGGLAGFLSIFLPLVILGAPYLGTLPLALLASVCGFTASLYLVKHHPRVPSPEEPVPPFTIKNDENAHSFL